MVVKHYCHKDGEEQTQENGDTRDGNVAGLDEHPAVAAKAGIGLHCNEDYSMCASQEDVDEELQEELLIVVANAVIYPRTMVVHPCDTSLTC